MQFPPKVKKPCSGNHQMRFWDGKQLRNEEDKLNRNRKSNLTQTEDPKPKTPIINANNHATHPASVQKLARQMSNNQSIDTGS